MSCRRVNKLGVGGFGDVWVVLVLGNWGVGVVWGCSGLDFPPINLLNMVLELFFSGGFYFVVSQIRSKVTIIGQS